MEKGRFTNQVFLTYQNIYKIHLRSLDSVFTSLMDSQKIFIYETLELYQKHDTPSGHFKNIWLGSSAG